MPKRAKLALLAVLTVALVASLAGVALAAVPPSGGWTDLSYSIVGKYGITLEQVGMISDGYADGSWRPWNNIPRNQFTKMAVEAYKIPLKNPATPTFTDVPASDLYYQYIEGAKAAGLINGVGGGKFAPDATITREQAAAIIVRWVAAKNGYDPATMYTDAEADAILAVFPDGASVSASLKKEIAFAVDFGVIWGTADAKLAPAATMTRIQGAAMIIRSWAIIPNEEPAIPADIALISADKEENLIGQVHTATFKVTDEAGDPVAWALVDFDYLTDPWYVGNVTPEAALTDENGEVTVNLLSTEIGIERVAASVRGAAGAIYTTYVTKYWVALDEVYILAPWDAYLEPDTIWAENNAGDVHTWEARVVVYGPGPLSTSRQDFYNAYDPGADLAAPQPADNITWFKGIADYADELSLPVPYIPRGFAGVEMTWAIYDKSDTDVSVGDIIAVYPDGTIAADKQSAVAISDEYGWTSIDIQSFETGYTYVVVTADYPENPYPTMLVDRDIYEDSDDYWEENEWEPQPSAAQYATKKWIPHIIDPGDEAPITPAYAVNNTGEVEEFTLTLVDVYGNPIPGYTVEWWVQGVGFFKTDGSTWVGPGEYNKDVDLTDAAGQASVWVKSLEPGQTIVHCKVMDKYGLPWKEWNVVKQWYSIDDVSFTDNYAENMVGTEHTWYVQVSGAKYVYTIYDINHNGLRDDKVLIGDRADLRDASGWYLDFEGDLADPKPAGMDVQAGVPFVKSEAGPAYIRFADIVVDLPEFWWDYNLDGIDEVWSYLEGKGINFFTNILAHDERGQNPFLVDEPLAPIKHLIDCYKKPVTTEVNGCLSPVLMVLGAEFAAHYDEPAVWMNVGAITGWGEAWTPEMYGGVLYEYDAVTDEMGQAWVKINSEDKGIQFVFAVADYPENPQDGDAALPSKWGELRADAAIKYWYPAGPDSYKVFAGLDLVEGNRWVNPVDPEWIRPAEYQWAGDDSQNPNVEPLALQVFDEYGNSLEGFFVEWEIVSQGIVTDGSIDTYHPYVHFADWPEVNGAPWSTPEHDWMYGLFRDGYAGVDDLNPNLNENAWWGDWADGLHPLQVPDDDDDNWSWGYTLNGEIDFTKSLDSAAYTTLVLDETYGELAASGYDHFTTIINVKLYTPEGDLWDHFEITKEWTLETPVVTSMELEQSFEDEWTMDDLVIYGDSLYTRGRVLDQWGRPMFTGDAAMPAEVKIQAVTQVAGVFYRQWWTVAAEQDGANDAEGYAKALFSGIAPQEWVVTAWWDTNGNNIIDTGEITSNTIVDLFVAEP